MKKQSVKNSHIPVIPILSFFLLLLAIGLLTFQLFKLPKEVKAVVGTLNIQGTTGTTNFPGGIWNSSGNVGIGNTSPTDAKLSVKTIPASTFGIETEVDSGGRGMRLLTTDYVNGLVGSSLRFMLGASTGNTYSSINARITGNGAAGNLVLQDDGGNVGIGTTSPGFKLDVQGRISASTGFAVATKDDAGAMAAGSGFFQTAAPVNYYAGASSWQHLIESRHSNDANNYALQIAGSFFDQDLYFRKTNNNPATPWNKFIYQNSGGNVGIGTANPTYKLHVVGSLYAGGSSREYKENISPLKLDSSKIYELEPKSYDYKPQYQDLGKKLSGGRQFGLIAEDVYQIYPELTLSDGTKNVANIDYEKLSVLLLSEMKNQKKEIDSLKLEIKNLEQRLILIELKLK